MAMNTYPIISAFSDRTMAENAIEALNNAGFTNDQISYSGHATGRSGFMAGLKSLFTGEDETRTNVVNDLTNLGVPQDQAGYYADEHAAGHPVVAVRANGREQEALSILRSAGGYNYNTTGTGMSGANTNTAYAQNADYTDQNTASPQNAGYTDQNTASPQNAGYTDQNTAYPQNAGYTDQNATDYANRSASTDQTNYNNTDTPETRSVRTREEQLQADKQTVQSGEVRLHKDIKEEQKSINVPVTHEEVYIERHPVDNRVSDTPIEEEETIRVPVSAEQVNVTKTPVETGEVTIGKRAVTENQQYTDTVRREEPRLEKDNDVPMQDRLTNQDNPRQ